ncbi:MAG: hypothetical protein ACMUIE_10875 [Thermoplasmatota archaeon]
MNEKTYRKQSEEFLRNLLTMNVLFPLFVTVVIVFLYIQGLQPLFLLGAVLLLMMGYNLIMAQYSFQLWIEVRKFLRKEC